MAKAVDCLPHKHEALSLNPCTSNKNGDENDIEIPSYPVRMAIIKNTNNNKRWQ
jgi:hypothetical protein